MRHKPMCWVGVLVCVVLAGCASASTPAASRSVRPLPPLDTRLVGIWHVVSASLPRTGSIHADDEAVLLAFRGDGLVTTNGMRCNYATHAGSTGRHLELRWSGRGNTTSCSGIDPPTETARRLEEAVDRIQWNGRIGYSTDGVRLRLAARGYRILLKKGAPR
ncbi:MAG TPA: hypothetical protein VGH43_18035 [Jatrophihabitans sp.]|jgi:hypothetical protein